MTSDGTRVPRGWMVLRSLVPGTLPAVDAPDGTDMGWRERDWAKLDDDELRALYGVERRAVAAPAAAVRRPPPYLLRRVSPRMIVWSLVGSLVAAFALALPGMRHRLAPASGGPAVLYGVPGTLGVCTEEEVVVGQWRCMAWTVNADHLPVVTPRSYVGACAHARADQDSGAWVCVSGVTDAPGT